MVEKKTDKSAYAVKIFDKQLILSDELERKCLLYELKMMRKVNHPHALRLREIYEGENYIYCLCDLLSGGHLLNKMIKTGHFSEGKALRLMQQLLASLQYLESLKIIHRDIKPENIIFRNEKEDSDIVLVDLGFATYCEDYNKLFTRCGTPGYVAPEVLHDKTYDCKADIFSAGTIFYIMLSGTVPFSAKTYEGLVEANMRCKIDFNFDKQKYKISPESMDLLEHMLCPFPEKRLTASQCLEHPVFAHLPSPCPMSPTHVKEESKKLQEFKDKMSFNLKKTDKHTDMPDQLDELNSPVASPMIRNAKAKASDLSENFSISPQPVQK